MDHHPETLAELTTAANEGEAAVIRATLSAQGIESWQHTANSVMLGVWGASGFNPTTVRVRESDLPRAREALDSARRDSIDLDWNEVDVGEPEDALASRIAARGRNHAGASSGGVSRSLLLVWLGVILALYALTGLFGAIVAIEFALVDLLRRVWIRRRYRL